MVQHQSCGWQLGDYVEDITAERSGDKVLVIVVGTFPGADYAARLVTSGIDGVRFETMRQGKVIFEEPVPFEIAKTFSGRFESGIYVQSANRSLQLLNPGSEF